ncbi:carboxymuconolactone decarboxylase family protein [Planktomarina sp.]|jgi:4-carboxymuconolactone decarboxylase|nr:carboxymuconolactone decarboxylase family protein [Planktomarina sp.]
MTQKPPKTDQRMKTLTPQDMSVAQLDVYTKILNGPRGKFGGPFPALLHTPFAANSLQELGAWLRFEGKLSAQLREIVILIAARKWQCRIEWDAHVAIARNEGVSDILITAIENETVPKGTTPKQGIILDFCRSLLDNKFVSDATYAGAKSELSEECLVELVVILGYYTLLSMILNVFEDPAQDHR